MGRKSVVTHRMFDEVDISTNQTSEITNILRQDKGSIHLTWTGAALDGVITVEAKNDEDDDFFEVDMGGTISITGASGEHTLIFNELPFYQFRLNYTPNAGTGNLNAVLTLKVVGA